MRHFDADLDPDAPTVFELVPNSVGALSVVTRGLPPDRRIGTLTVRSAARATLTHFRGRAEGWLDVDRETADTVVARMRDERPDYLFAAFTGVDKASHARGHDDPMVHEAMSIVDDAVARLRHDAEADGRWADTHLWVVSDHGHADVHTHLDLVRVVAETGLRTVAHPWSATLAPDAAVMVSGNAMSHVYLDLARRDRPWWPSLAQKHEGVAHALLECDAVDLMLLPHGPARCEVRSRTRGSALVERCGDTYRYARGSGDPLGVGADLKTSADDAFDATRDGDYPDAIVQIATLAGSARAGDIILSATPGWDFRSRYEPIPHRSAHGALHRDHMMVPLLMNRRAARAPRRTTDLFASALDALGATPPAEMDGESFL
jgi:arylsulfatase A-like enzyme